MSNKDFLPYYNSLNEDDKQFWLECTKETLIETTLVSGSKLMDILQGGDKE